MTVGVACPECRHLIGVAAPNIEIVKPVAGGVAGTGILRAAAACPECKKEFPVGSAVDVVLAELVDNAKRKVNVK